VADKYLALKWFTAAAEQGDGPAAENLADMYADDNSPLKNKRLAAKWYLVAAKAESGWAAYRLGLLYSKGDGVPKNYEFAYKWLSIAAALLDEKAVADERDEAAKFLTQSQLVHAQALATKCMNSEYKDCGD
jgi:TPR repeat protein